MPVVIELSDACRTVITASPAGTVRLWRDIGHATPLPGVDQGLNRLLAVTIVGTWVRCDPPPAPRIGEVNASGSVTTTLVYEHTVPEQSATRALIAHRHRKRR